MQRESRGSSSDVCAPLVTRISPLDNDVIEFMRTHEFLHIHLLLSVLAVSLRSQSSMCPEYVNHWRGAVGDTTYRKAPLVSIVVKSLRGDKYGLMQHSN